jgi:uncharacterized RDD family membrane protein YckC
MATNVRDPRSVITPDAFAVDPRLLGTPLAAPWLRFWALLIDLVFIGVLTAITDSVSLFVWGGVALFFVSMAFRSPGQKRGQMSSMLFRGATGCLGIVILIGVLIGFLATRGSGRDDDDDDRPDLPDVVGVPGGPGVPLGLGDALRGGLGVASFAQADDSAEAREALQGFLEMSAAGGAGGDELREAARGLRALAPEDASWRGDVDVIVERALAAVMPAADEPDTATDEASADLAAEVASLSDADALRAFATLLDDTAGADPARIRLLRARALPLLAADTLSRLEGALDEAAGRREDLEEDLEEVREELEEGRGGLGALLRDIWDQLGSALGLWSVYFTVALTLTRGQTVGKKILGLRVLRLDGEPITWWFAFERAGGYAAGIATGLLGFAQVFWDPNRQCVHDKIGGTVVVVDGARPIPGAWQEAWKEGEASA